MLFPLDVVGCIYVYSDLTYDPTSSEKGRTARFWAVVKREQHYARAKCSPYFKYRCKIFIDKKSHVDAILKPGNLVMIRGRYIVDTVKVGDKYQNWHYVEIKPNEVSLIYKSTKESEQFQNQIKVEVQKYSEETASTNEKNWD